MIGEAFRRWRADEVRWGLTMCEAPGCLEPAAMLAEVEEWSDAGVPVCVECCDRLFDRAAAFEFAPVAELPDPWEDHRRPPRRRQELAEWELEGRSPEKWLEEKGWVR